MKVVGLIGCGDIAARHARVLCDNVHGLRLAVAFDVDPNKCAALCGRFGLDSARSLGELLGRDIDVVCICTPNATHAELAQAALRAGKHVILEHPLAMTMIGAEQVCLAADRARRHVFVMRQRRYLPSIQSLRCAVLSGALGRVKKIDATMLWSRSVKYFTERPWRGCDASGGVVVNQASHFLDILIYLFGDPVRVASVRGNQRHVLPVEDTAAGVMTFPDGFDGRFYVTIACPDGCNTSSLVVEGERGRVQLGGKEWDSVVEWTIAERPSPDDLASVHGDHRDVLQRVARRLAGEEAVEIVDAREGARVVRLIDRISAGPMVDPATLVEWRPDGDHATRSVNHEQRPHHP